MSIKKTNKYVYLICNKCKKKSWLKHEKYNELKINEFNYCNKCISIKKNNSFNAEKLYVK